MKTLYRILLAILAIMAVSCDKEPTDNGHDEPLGTYVFNGEEYPVHSISCVADENVIAIVISPLEDGKAKSTYAMMGMNVALEGTEVDIERAWHNDDYYFVYEDPVRYYSQYRKLKSGSLYIKRTGDNIDISADLILPDGTDFQFEYSGTASATL